MKALRGFCIGTSFFGCLISPFVGSREIWFEYDTNRQNVAYQWKVKVEIPQEDSRKAVGHNRYLTEPVDV